MMNEAKEHIIVIASKLFLQKSFKEVTLKEIVNETGLSKGAFYHYFTSKEQLFLEVLNYFFSDVFVHKYETYSRESFKQFYHDYANAIHHMGRRYFEKIKEEDQPHTITLNYFNLVFDALKLFPEFKEKMIVGFRKEIDIWSDVVKQARAKGEINSEMTDQEIAQTYIALSDGMTMNTIIQGVVPLEDITPPFLSLWDKLYNQMKT